MPGRAGGRRAGREPRDGREGKPRTREGRTRNKPPPEPMSYAEYAVAFATSFSSAFTPSATIGSGGSADAFNVLEEEEVEKGITVPTDAPAKFEQTKPKSSGASLLSCFCGSRTGKEVLPQELPFEEAAFLLVCPKGHDLQKQSVDMNCSNCTAAVRTAMHCEQCEWGVCSKCYNAMCVAKPRKIPLFEGRLPKPPSSRSVGTSAAVTLSLELTLDELLKHGKGLREWFDSQLYIQAMEKGVRVGCIPLLEQHVNITDAKGGIYDSYKALMQAGISEEALPIVFKFDTELAMSMVSNPSKSSMSSITTRQEASPTGRSRQGASPTGRSKASKASKADRSKASRQSLTSLV